MDWQDMGKNGHRDTGLEVIAIVQIRMRVVVEAMERKLNTHSKGCKISIMMSAVKMWSVGLSKDLTNHVRMRELAAGEMRRA